MNKLAGFATIKKVTHPVYVGDTCPKCGCDSHVILNATAPTVNQCCACAKQWNPNSQPEVRKAA